MIERIFKVVMWTAILVSVVVASQADAWGADANVDKFAFQGQQVRVITTFDNGELAKVEEQERNVLDCWPYAAANFHFRLEGCRDQKIVFRFHVMEGKAGGVSLQYANPDFPVFSYDRKQWHRTANKSLLDDPQAKGGKIVRMEQTFAQDTAWLAFQYPYSNEMLSDFIAGVKGSRFVTIEVAGRSTEGRDIRQICVTDPDVPLARKRVVWVTGIQHCRETGAGWGMEGMVQFLLSEDPVAAEARSKFLFKVIPVVNVDALAEGKGVIHSSGRNLNREWESADPVPEIASLRKTLDDWKERGNRTDIFIDIHGFSSKNGRWTAVVMPKSVYAGQQADQYGRLQQAIHSQFPTMLFAPNEAKGYAQGAGCRRWGALSMSIDGWVYADPSGKTANLSSRYEKGVPIMALEDIRAAGESYVRALVDFARQ